MPIGKHYLAWMYDTGVGVSPDKARAFQLWREAAEARVPESLTAIGSYYEHGDVVKKDLATAYYWYLVAERYGAEDASEKRVALEKSLEEQQIAEARAAASEA